MRHTLTRTHTARPLAQVTAAAADGGAGRRLSRAATPPPPPSGLTQTLVFWVSRAPEPLELVLALDDAVLDMTQGVTQALWAGSAVTLVEVRSEQRTRGG
jgi:hypothetical protein